MKIVIYFSLVTSIGWKIRFRRKEPREDRKLNKTQQEKRCLIGIPVLVEVNLTLETNLKPIGVSGLDSRPVL